MKKAKFAWATLLTASLLGNLLQYQENEKIRRNVPYSASDQDIVEKALALYVLDSKARHPDVIGNRFPVVAVTREQRCVNLMMPQGQIGWIPIYCFDWKGNLISKDRI